MKRAAGVLVVLALALGAARLGAQWTSTPVAEYWLRMYPTPVYSEIWRLGLQVPSLKKALPKALALLEKQGAVPVVPVANMAASKKSQYQQLSYRLPAKTAAKTLKALQALGEVQILNKNPALNPAVDGEVNDKLAKLKAEQAAHAEALAKMPSVGAAVTEIVSHLEAVSKADREAAERILLNLDLQEAASASPTR